jgi:hypothetical protein
MLVLSSLLSPARPPWEHASAGRRAHARSVVASLAGLSTFQVVAINTERERHRCVL